MPAQEITHLQHPRRSEEMAGGHMRIDILDGIRGHLLIGMLVAHLSFHPDLTWLRFAHHHYVIGLHDAEFFIPVAGFLIGALLAGRLGEEGRFSKFLRDRLATIYKYYLVSAIPFVLIEMGAFGTPAKTTADGFFQLMVDIVTGQDGGLHSDILPIYFYCFLILGVFRIILGMKPLVWLGGSAVIYVGSQIWPSFGFFGLSDFVIFNIAAWQLLFFAAIAGGHSSKDISRVLAEAAPWQRYGAFLGFVAVTLTLRGWWFFNPVDAIEYGFKTNSRMQLHPLVLLHATAAIGMFVMLLASGDRILTLLAAPAKAYFAFSPIATLGKYSIQMFVFHVFLVASIVEVSRFLDVWSTGIVALLAIAIFIATPSVWQQLRQLSRTNAPLSA
jgi:hypothetical protein